MGKSSMAAKAKPSPKTQSFSAKETKARYEAALRGAFATPPQPLKSMTPKRPKAQLESAKKKPAK
jgi:hypothetical protein